MKKYLFVDYRTSGNELQSLSTFCDNIILCPKHQKLYKAISGHIDIQIHKVSENTIMVHKDIDTSFIKRLENLKFSVIKSEISLGEKYPFNIALNALNFGDFFVHNLKYTDKKLLNLVKSKILIDVKQGYSKCSCVIVKDNAIITNDKKVHEKLLTFNIDSLFLPPGDILLPGLNYGFIGGTCGFISKDTLGFFGSLDHYMYGDMVKTFLNKHNVKYIYLNDGKLIDRGSIFSFEF